MIDGIEPLYQQVGDSIQNSIPEDWSSAKMEAIFYSDSITFFGEYVSQVDKRLKDFSTPRDAQRAIREIRRRFQQAGKPLWGQATFEVHADGKFNVKWGYENIDEEGNTIFDEEAYLLQDEERRKRLAAGS